MTRYLILIAFVACTKSKAEPPPTPVPTPVPIPVPAPKPEPKPEPPRNFICERIKILNDKAECVPELTSAGDGDIHRARVTVDKTVLSCGIANGQLEAVCTDKIMVWMGTDPKPEASAEPKRKPAVKPTAKGKP